MIKVTIVEPNISAEESERNLKIAFEVLESIAQEIRESENLTTD